MTFRYCSTYEEWKVYLNNFSKGAMAVIIEESDFEVLLAEVTGIIPCSNDPGAYYQILDECEDPATEFEKRGIAHDYVAEFITDEDNYLVSFKLIEAADITSEEGC